MMVTLSIALQNSQLGTYLTENVSKDIQWHPGNVLKIVNVKGRTKFQ